MEIPGSDLPAFGPNHSYKFYAGNRQSGLHIGNMWTFCPTGTTFICNNRDSLNHSQADYKSVGTRPVSAGIDQPRVVLENAAHGDWTPWSIGTIMPVCIRTHARTSSSFFSSSTSTSSVAPRSP